MSDFSFSFSVFGNRYYFTPKFALVAIAITLTLFTLGIWQWQSAKTTIAVIELINKRLMLDPIQIDNLDKGGDWQFYPIQVQGNFDNEHQILLINRTYKGQTGFQVLTPFKPSNSSSAILVDRGWIVGDPNKAPDLRSASESVTITGILFKPAAPFWGGSSFDERNIQWPLLSKYANIDKYSKAISSPLYSYILLLSPSSPYGFTREWVWLTNTTEPARQVRHATQWFALALMVLVGFVFMSTQRENRN